MTRTVPQCHSELSLACVPRFATHRHRLRGLERITRLGTHRHGTFALRHLTRRRADGYSVRPLSRIACEWTYRYRSASLCELTSVITDRHRILSLTRVARTLTNRNRITVRREDARWSLETLGSSGTWRPSERTRGSLNARESGCTLHTLDLDVDGVGPRHAQWCVDSGRRDAERNHVVLVKVPDTRQVRGTGQPH